MYAGGFYVKRSVLSVYLYRLSTVRLFRLKPQKGGAKYRFSAHSCKKNTKIWGVMKKK